MAEHAASALVRVGNSAELVTRYARDPVVTCHTLVEKGVVRGVELEQTPILANEVIEEDLRFANQVVA